MAKQKNLFRVPTVKTTIRRKDNGVTLNIDLVDEDATHFYYREGPKGNESIGHWPKSEWERFSEWEIRRLGQEKQPDSAQHALTHLTNNEFRLYRQVNKCLSDAITLLHEMGVHEAKISAEYNNDGEVLFHVLSIRLGLLVSALERRHICPTEESEQLLLDARIKALNEAGINPEL